MRGVVGAWIGRFLHPKGDLDLFDTILRWLLFCESSEIYTDVRKTRLWINESIQKFVKTAHHLQL